MYIYIYSTKSSEIFCIYFKQPNWLKRFLFLFSLIFFANVHVHFISSIWFKLPKHGWILFFLIYNINTKKRVISQPWKKTCHYEYVIFLILLTKSIRKVNARLVHFSNLFKKGGRKYIEMCWGQVLIPEQFCADYIPPILLKPLDRGLMSVLVWVHLLMMYHQNETLKTSFGLGYQ